MACCIGTKFCRNHKYPRGSGENLYRPKNAGDHVFTFLLESCGIGAIESPIFPSLNKVVGVKSPLESAMKIGLRPLAQMFFCILIALFSLTFVAGTQKAFACGQGAAGIASDSTARVKPSADAAPDITPETVLLSFPVEANQPPLGITV